MKTIKLKNTAKRALGIPGAHGFIVVQPGEVVSINQSDLDVIKKNKTAAGWLRTGLITTDVKVVEVINNNPDTGDVDNNPDVTDVGEKPTGEPVIEHTGAGWYTVTVAGIEVSQGKLRKADAEALAAQYSEE